MPELTNQTFEPDFSRTLDIESLISAPLVAVSKANVTMAQGQTKFLLDYCFKKNEDSYEPVMIKMAFSRSVVAHHENTKDLEGNSTFESITTYFNLPLLTIVPLNSLAVDKIKIAFDMEISGFSTKESDSIPGAGNKITDQKPQLYGSIGAESTGKDSDARRNKGKITVDISASTLPLPSGIITIINLYNKAITASPEENQINK